MLAVAHRLQPARFALADGHCIAVVRGFLGERSHVRAADNHANAHAAVSRGQAVGFLDLRRITRYGHQVKVGGKVAKLRQVRHLEVFDFVFVSYHGGERDETEAGQRSDHLAAFDEAGQGQPQAHQLRVADANPAHSNQTNLHANNLHTTMAAAAMTLPAGRKKRCRNRSWKADA